jgi:hypothetical protein
MVLYGGHVARWLILPILALMVLAAVVAGTAAPAFQAEAVPAPAVLAAPPAGPSPVPASASGGPTAAPAAPAIAQAAVSTSPGPPAAVPPPPADPAQNGLAHPATPADRSESRAAAILRAASLAVVLGLTAIRAYAPVIRYDWPQVRGLDHFSHAVMAEQMPPAASTAPT